MSARLFLALAGALLIVRLPSLVQPMGADQGLYAYVGERILAGEVAYRDAWDQKPPAVHFIYAGLRAVWPYDGAVAAADLCAAGVIGWLLFRLGHLLRLPDVGAASGLLFLFLSNPAFTRLAGVRLRGQCETFIALAVTAAFVLLARHRLAERSAFTFAAGVLLGVAVALKYNAAVYVPAALLVMWLWHRLSWRDTALVLAGSSVPLLLLVGYFAANGAVASFYDATVTYNLRYSGETYAGPGDALRYLLTFPVEHARIDALWTLGGAGSLVLVAGAFGGRVRLLAPIWVAAACLSIAVNGSRGLPQYFVQANPALALAAGYGGVVAWAFVRARLRRRQTRLAVALTAVVVIGVAVWRVNQFPKLVEQTMFDLRYALGAMSRVDHLARYADERKYASLAAAELAAFLDAHSTGADTVYVFGFTCSAYVNADRASASRFFWSRPVIVGFNDGQPGYGASGLLADLQRGRPAVVALQRKDWAPDVADSAEFFLSTPQLSEWLNAGYERRSGPEDFDVWVRKGDAQ